MIPHPLSTHQPTCPPQLLKQAQLNTLNNPQRLVIAQATSTSTLIAVRLAIQANLITPIFVAHPEKLLELANQLQWDISPWKIVAAENDTQAAQIATQIIRNNQADILMKGQIATSTLMKAALNKQTGIRHNNQNHLIHIFYLSPPNHSRPILLSDAALNPNPSIEIRKISIQYMINIAHAIGIKKPNIALLSATETPTPTIPSSLEAQTLSQWAQQTFPPSIASVNGPYALDLILSTNAAKIKGLQNDTIAGNADGIISPDIVSGNALYKALVYLGGYCAAGLVLGAKIPIILTSRADPPEARLAALALALCLKDNDPLN